MIELHTTMTPNGLKVLIMLEETGLDYVVVAVDIMAGDQFAKDYLKLSPNNKIPTIVDTDGPGGGRYTMMESGAILLYLAEKSGQFLPTDDRRRHDVSQWLFFQMAHIGPMFGQANHFNDYAKEDVTYAKERYNNEVQRLFTVLENRLAESAYLGCADYTIADIATYPWVKRWQDRGLDIDKAPNFKRWLDDLEARPAVQKSNAEQTRLREEMKKAREGKEDVDIFDTKKNAEMLAAASKRA